MGLTIHYKLKAKGTAANAHNLVTALHQAALDLPFKEVGNIVDVSGDECDFDRRGPDDPLRWLLIQAQGSVSLSQLPGESEYSSRRVSPTRLPLTTNPGVAIEPGIEIVRRLNKVSRWCVVRHKTGVNKSDCGV